MVRYEKDTLIIEIPHCDPEGVHFRLLSALLSITTHLCDKPVADDYILHSLATLSHHIGEPLSRPSQSIEKALRESYEDDQRISHQPFGASQMNESVA
ncbi:hypothetical protein ACO2Q8_04065 [Larkinella sp. VNQ87]|uniref:hypothetical protein n=1 Tax=Larkinella sp. VNQ87 TaxID=3400921 RepID=UPI003C0D8D1D